jgi:vancomycin permeability regulator SanA
MLNDRLKRGTELYFAGAAPKIIMSGDHGTEEYDEVNAMKRFAIDAGIESSDVFMDHAGFSTYESIYRAKEIFGADRIIIVTQEYHLYRALYIARGLGIEAYGVESDYRTYQNQMKRELREVLARFKDFVNTVLEPKPTYLGEPIDINGDGNVTNG